MTVEELLPYSRPATLLAPMPLPSAALAAAIGTAVLTRFSYPL